MAAPFIRAFAQPPQLLRRAARAGQGIDGAPAIARAGADQTGSSSAHFAAGRSVKVRRAQGRKRIESDEMPLNTWVNRWAGRRCEFNRLSRGSKVFSSARISRRAR